MKITFKLVALDIDGTLLNKERRLTPEIKEAIRRVRERGTEVTLCTGRMFRAALPYAEELELELPLIAYNGGLVMQAETKEILYRRSLPGIYAKQIVRAAREKRFAINYYYEDRLLVEEINEANRLYAEWSKVPLEQVEDLVELPYEPTKILVMGNPEELDVFWAEHRELLGEEVYITKSWSSFLEFLHPEATKGKGLAALARHLGIERGEVMCMGDSFNDLEMFAYAGLAIAMGNADEAVKKAADYITGTNEENGVAQALEKFILRQ